MKCCSAAYAAIRALSIPIAWLCWGGLSPSGLAQAALATPALPGSGLVKPVNTISVRQILESGANMKAVDDVVYISGTIDPDQDARLRDIALIMARGGMAPSLVVFLANEGGHLGAAMRLGRLIRQLGANTAVTGMCASACIYAYAGGARRVTTPDSRLLLHQARRADGRGGTAAEDEQVARIRYQYLEEMGVDPVLVAWEAELAPNQMRWVISGEALAARLATERLAAEDIPLPADE